MLVKLVITSIIDQCLICQSFEQSIRTKTFATDREEVKSRKREKKVKEEKAGQKRLRLNFAYVHALK